MFKIPLAIKQSAHIVETLEKYGYSKCNTFSESELFIFTAGERIFTTNNENLLESYGRFVAPYGYIVHEDYEEMFFALAALNSDKMHISNDYVLLTNKENEFAYKSDGIDIDANWEPARVIDIIKHFDDKYIDDETLGYITKVEVANSSITNFPQVHIFIAIDKDGTEKISNHQMFDSIDALKRIQERTDDKYLKETYIPEQMKRHDGVWCDDFTNGHWSMPKFSGTILLPGTLEKIIGRKITHEDGIIEL